MTEKRGLCSSNKNDKIDDEEFLGDRCLARYSGQYLRPGLAAIVNLFTSSRNTKWGKSMSAPPPTFH
jgi:hypothetical protein